MQESIAGSRTGITPLGKQKETTAAVEFVDRFADDQSAGTVIGTEVASGIVRRGVDKEGVIAVDNGALRIQPLTTPQWGRAGIAYGPYARECGLAFGVFLLNCHNTSQAEPIAEGFRMRLQRWALGTETDPPLRRLKKWARSRQRRYMPRRLLQWIKSGTKYLDVPRIDENLAVGWFPSEAPVNPLQQGNSFIMHALGSECGGLWARTGSSTLPAIRGLQNVQMYYIVVLRKQGAAYYAASIAGVPDLAGYPQLRPLAIDALNDDKTVFAGIHQSVLGQIGFRNDTRVYRTQVALVSEFDNWYGSAHGADELTGEGSLHMSSAEVGGEWKVCEGSFERTDDGLLGRDTVNAALLFPDSPAGLVHLVIKTTARPVERVGIIWRARDEENFWCLDVGSRQCQLAIVENGTWQTFPATRQSYLAPNALNSLQVSDDGENIRLYLNGDFIYGTAFVDARLQQGVGVGIRTLVTKNDLLLRSFEAHPREIPLPQVFELGEPWFIEGNQVAVEDDFSGPVGDLAGRATMLGAGRWERTIGRGHFELTGDRAAKVIATVTQPCPGRTAYTVDWQDLNFADVEVTITPPGTQRGTNEKGRGGLIFWEDSENYIVVSLWMDDSYGFSISSFFRVSGYEELYDAVWTNIGKRIHWGVPYAFRVVFDSKRFLAFVNREPVLYRALTDVYPDWDKLLIRKVGIVANWEWGNDTGSIFESFVARKRA